MHELKYVITTALVLSIFVVAIVQQSVFTFDFISRILLAEQNYYLNRWRRRTKTSAQDSSEHKPMPIIASVIGHREDPLVFKRCLSSYRDHLKAGILVVGVDGRNKDDMEMPTVYSQVFGVRAVCELEKPLSVVAESILLRLRKHKDFRDLLLADQHRKLIAELVAVVRYRLKRHFCEHPPEDHTHALATLCFNQPHTHIKGIRFAAWVLCLALAELYHIDYIWSSDSDTWLVDDVVDLTVSVLEGDPSLGATSALITTSRWPNYLAWSQYRCLVLLDAAFLAAHGRSSCITGPSACFRVDALRDILPYWLYHRDTRGEGISSEDTVATTWLGKRGWRRGYVTDCHVETSAPTSLLPWIRQQCRWYRGWGNERVTDWAYTIDQGPCYLWWTLRDEFFDAVFKFNLFCTLVGFQPYNTGNLEWLSCLVFPVLYNYFRVPDYDYKLYDIILTPLMMLLHLVCMQFVHIWATFTPWEDAGNTPAGERRTRKQWTLSLRDIAFSCWIGLLVIAAIRY